MLQKLLICALAVFSLHVSAQKEDITISDEKLNNRLFLYATNTSEQDLDVTLTVEGSGFRQSTRKPRAYRVPAASKVQMLSLVIERGKTPVYNATVEATTELSRRALRKPAEAIKIDPKKPILIYITEACATCDAVVSRLDSSYYKYRKMVLSEKPEVKATIVGAFKNTVTPYESIKNPIVSLGGKLYVDIDTYDKLLETINKE